MKIIHTHTYSVSSFGLNNQEIPGSSPKHFIQNEHFTLSPELKRADSIGLSILRIKKDLLTELSLCSWGSVYLFGLICCHFLLLIILASQLWTAPGLLKRCYLPILPWLCMCPYAHSMCCLQPLLCGKHLFDEGAESKPRAKHKVTSWNPHPAPTSR